MTSQLRIISLVAATTMALLSGCMADSPERQAAHQNLARWEDQRFAPEDSMLSMIKDDDAHVRLQALRSAGLIGQRSVVPAMIAALADPSETVARQAAFSLGLMGDDSAVPALEAVLAVPGSRLHLAAAKGLAHLDHEGQGLLKATTFKDPLVAAAAWDGLRNIASRTDSTALVAAIIEGLNYQQTLVLWRVLRCAERLPAKELIPHLVPHVRSNIAQVRVHAFRALARQNTPLALKAVLVGCSQSNPSGDIHQRTMIAACRALGSLGSHAFKPENILADEERHLLTETLIEGAGQSNPHLAAISLAAMEQLAGNFNLPPEAASQESLLPVWRIRLSRSAHSHLEQENPVVRAAAIRSWTALRGSGSEAELQNMMNSSPGTTDLEAILFSMGRIATSPLPILSNYSSDHDAKVSVRVAALDGLHHAGTRFQNADDQSFILDKLTQAAADSDFVITASAIGYLADFPARVSLVAMAEAWDTSFPEGEAEVKRAILATLTAYGTDIQSLKRPNLPEGIPDRLLSITATMLRQAFDSSDLRIRLEAREAAISTGLLPSQLIPAEGSLRATLPAFQRNGRQPALRMAFSAPKVKCVTDQGSFTIQLNGEIAPNTCAMFMDLINRGYYENLTFHRIVPDFVVQGGDPRGDGWGGPGYTIRSEWSRSQYQRAFVGIAHDGKDTGGSQFFITLSEQPHLNGRYTIFGEVVANMEIVDKLGIGDHFHFQIMN